MEKFYKDYEGKILTFNAVKNILREGLYIGTIKVLRNITGMGLKEAKDAVDQNCAVRHNPEGTMFIDYDRAVKYFEQFFKPDTKGLRDALNLALDCWEPLGFESPIKACEAVLINFGLEVMHPARG